MKGNMTSDSPQTANEQTIISKAEKFISNPENQVEVDHSRRRCVDGGYKPGESDGSLAIAGADLGTSMALLAMENPKSGKHFTPQEAFDTVYSFLQDHGMGPYCWHSDTHEGHDGVIVGCGHCNAAINEMSEMYGVAGESVRKLLEIVRSAEAGETMKTEFIKLDREHAEQGILINTGHEMTVKPWNMETDEQYFVYDAALHDEYLEMLAESVGLDLNVLKEIVEKQTTATLGSLVSSKGKPMIEINLDNDGISVKIIGTAPISA